MGHYVRPCMTGLYPRDHEVIHSGRGRENVDNLDCGRVPGCREIPLPCANTHGGAGIRRSPRRLPFRPWLCRAVPERGRPTSPGVLNGCPSLNRIITRRGARDNGQGSSRGQQGQSVRQRVVLRTTPRAGGHVASQPRGDPCGGRQAAITAGFTSVFMTGASRLSCPLRASPKRWAIWPTASTLARIGTVRSRACSSSGCLPQERGGSPGAALVDARQVADVVDGETVTRAWPISMIAGAAIKAVIPSRGTAS